MATTPATPATLKDIVNKLLTILVVDPLVLLIKQELEHEIRALVLAEQAELYSHVVSVEESVTVIGTRLNRMQDGLRTLGDVKAPLDTG